MMLLVSTSGQQDLRLVVQPGSWSIFGILDNGRSSRPSSGVRVSPWNWKTFQVNGDCYHHIGAHPDTLETSFPGSSSYSIPNNGAFTFIWCPMREKLIVEDDDGRHMPGEMPMMAGLTERQRTAFCLIYVLPNDFIFVQPDLAAVARFFPTGPEEIYLHTDIMLPPQRDHLCKTRTHGLRNHAGC